jgi:hypothetical protein
MINILNTKLFVPIVMIIFLVALYYFINYKVKSVLKHELKKMGEKKNKKLKDMNEKKQKLMESDMRKQKNERHQQQMDMDSYIDPAQLYDNNELDMQQPKHRLSKNDILMRDLAEMD